MPYSCIGLEDFGFEVSETGEISFDSTILTDQNEWKDDADEWMNFLQYEFDFLDARGRKRNIPKTHIKKSRKKISKPVAAEHRREGLGKRPCQDPAVETGSSGFLLSSLRLSRDSNDSATSSTRYGKIGPVDSEEMITVKGLSRNNMRRSFPANQPVLVMNMPSNSSTNVMITGLHKQRKSALKAAGVTLESASPSSSSRKPSRFKNFRLRHRYSRFENN
jgi:hypothetical protein